MIDSDDLLRLAGSRGGNIDYQRLMEVLTTAIGLVEEHLPIIGKEAYSLATRVWVEKDLAQLQDLTDMRVKCIQYLKSKNGTSVAVINDSEDAAVRALLSVLHETRDEDDFVDVADWVATMVNRVGDFRFQRNSKVNKLEHSSESKIFQAANELSDATGVDQYAALMSILTERLATIEDFLPQIGLQALAHAREVWPAGNINDPVLTEYRVACWQYLDSRSERDSTKFQIENSAIRALICVLWPKDEDEADVKDTVEWFVIFLQQRKELHQK